MSLDPDRLRLAARLIQAVDENDQEAVGYLLETLIKMYTKPLWTFSYGLFGAVLGLMAYWAYRLG